MHTKIINLMGGPGVGKSTVATGVFSQLKQRKISCELVTEYAKESVWEGTQKLLENQIHVFSEQFRRQFRLLNKVSYVVTDSPLLLSSIYFDHYFEKLSKDISIFTPEYTDLLRRFFEQTFLQFDNEIFYLNRVKEYDPNGRNQSLEEAKVIDDRALTKLKEKNIEYYTVSGTESENINAILNFILDLEWKRLDASRPPEPKVWFTSNSNSDTAAIRASYLEKCRNQKPWTQATEENWPGDIKDLYANYGLPYPFEFKKKKNTTET